MPSQDEINDRHKAYLDYRAYLRTSHVESSRSLDEALAALSSGAIAISISFVHFLVPDPVRFGLMASAWLLFASTLTVNLLSFRFAERDFYHSLSLLDDDYEAGRVSKELTKSGYEIYVLWSNRLGVFFFVVGLALLIFFAVENLGEL